MEVEKAPQVMESPSGMMAHGVPLGGQGEYGGSARMSGSASFTRLASLRCDGLASSWLASVVMVGESLPPLPAPPPSAVPPVCHAMGGPSSPAAPPALSLRKRPGLASMQPAKANASTHTAMAGEKSLALMA